ncbi:Stk1 family PASTA domain-containing Ser/Thr kinase [Populibacterium corticicola]|uniref:non-specific serine/threonine protein kinase n=1 Tax=Populibacterium corticicola TaxID=1812826 RepID=A0ABW5XFM2_9MICO
MVNPVPRTLAGRYEVGELIGRGGMAEVHIGHDNRLGRTVAIKILRSDLARDPSFQARFRREAQAAASLNHPAIVAVYDTGEDTFTDPATGAVSHVPFIVMEYVEGHTVRDILRDGNAVPIEEAIEITAGVLSALEYSHHAGIVHRDIKPANVMLTPTGAVKVMDFGIARAVADSAATMTQTHSVIGTAQYLSPEQARGESVDTRSDLYSTGCLLYELLTGRPPFTGDSPVAVAYQHVRELAAPPSTIAPDVPPVLNQIALKALAKDRNDRYSSASEFRAALEAAARGESIEATSVYPAAAAVDPFATQVITPVAASPAHSPATQAFSAPAEAGLPWQQPAEEPGLFEEDDEEEVSSKKRLIWTLVAVGVAAILAIIAIWMLGGDDDTPETITVPSFAGMTEEEARDELETAGFEGKINILNVLDDNVEEGKFVSSDPAEGADLEITGEIDLTFSTGPNATQVPDVKGLPQDEAQRIIEAANLKVQFGDQEHSADVARNHVIRTEPSAREPIAVGGTVVIFVSDGFVEIEDYTDKPRSEAEAALRALGLSVKIDPREDDRVNDGDLDADTVLAQLPGAGAVEQGSEVTLTVAVEVEIEYVVVPDVVGRSQADAESLIVAEGLVPIFADPVYSNEPPGTVISTNPRAGARLNLGERVDIQISAGPEPSPDPTQPDPGNGDNGDDGGEDQEEG